MATRSTGGFSTSDMSLAHFDSVWVEIVAIVFMLAGGIPFVLYVQAMRGEPAMLWRDPQVRTLLAGVAAVVLILKFWLWLERGMAPLPALRYSPFNLVSIVTQTGFRNHRYPTR